MSGFQETWRDRVLDAVEALEGTAFRREVEGLAGPFPGDGTAGTPDWAAVLVGLLRERMSEEHLTRALQAGSCRRPAPLIEEARRAWTESGNLDRVLDVLRDQMIRALRDGMLFEEDLVGRVVGEGWGLAGRRDGSRILVTKIPRSGNLRAYLEETDRERSRGLYCHCPWVASAREAGVETPEEHCLCGAGFYRHLWEGILGTRVEVEILGTICSGADACSFAIHLPGS